MAHDIACTSVLEMTCTSRAIGTVQNGCETLRVSAISGFGVKNCPQKLLCVIKNPVTQYLPVNSRKIGFSYSSEKSIPMRDYVAAVSDDVDLVFVVGAMAHGKISNDYTDDFIANKSILNQMYSYILINT
ncbi:hypothetical protein VitviT2T_019880 [Vitis vinifera]|uniref:Ribosomal RNA small subunit methyltransferase NEP1 n=1 Tax=Vitis vinifera TaxID=29760 RepID=A0ABY9D1V3_VITVI|nr:hypothetical protein VitviT2T_019880 [Vitis vinifera]